MGSPLPLRDRLLERLETCVAHPDDIPQTDIAFHNLVHLASDNALPIYLGRLVGSLMSMQVKMTTENLEFFKKGLHYHRKLAEAIDRRDADDAEAMSAALVRMPYDDLAGRLRLKAAIRL